MAYISFDKYGPEYRRLWDSMRIIRDAKALESMSDLIKKYKSVYQRVEDETGVPWQMVAVIHIREAGVQDVGRFQCVLHNGERIVGLRRKTRLVPAGRGPFMNWHDAAVDALKMKGFHKIKDWPVERILWALEPYNGYGYRNRGLRSPYLWASTNHQQRGKYIADGVFSRYVMDRQIGCAALLRFLEVGKVVETKPGSIVSLISQPEPVMLKVEDEKPVSEKLAGVLRAVAPVAVTLLVMTGWVPEPLATPIVEAGLVILVTAGSAAWSWWAKRKKSVEVAVT